MTKDEALKLAQEALESAYARLVTKCEQNLVTYNGVDVDTLTLSQEAITAIKEALAQPEQETPKGWKSEIWKSVKQQEQEPVTWGVDWGKAGDIPCVSIIKRTPGGGIEVVAVEYGPQRTWVGLTDEELPPLVGDNGKYMELQQVRRFYKYIEAKLKEKNT